MKVTRVRKKIQHKVCGGMATTEEAKDEVARRALEVKVEGRRMQRRPGRRGMD